MNIRFNKTIFVMLAASVFIISAPAHARIKCWTNSEGVRECGTSVPPEYAQKEHQELSKQGLVKKKVERAKTEEELKEEARLAEIEKQKLAAEAERKHKDKILLDTFSKVEDIELTRDDKIAVIDSNIKLAKKRNEKIQADLDKRIASAAADERAGKQPSEALLKDIESLKRQIENNNKHIAAQRMEQEQIRKDYEKDIARFKALKGIQ